jgi:catechol 2,3-dioxygenase-like lactoylglutathione lyase family enzyme
MAVIRYLVKSVDSSIPFYEVLGFKVRERWGPAFAILEREGLELWLSGPQTSAAQAMPDGRVPSPGGWNRLVLRCDELLLKVHELRGIGAQFRNEPVSGPGGIQVLIDDPSGNPIELFQTG